jgi:hypothetical protein
MSILALTSDTLIGTPATGNIEYNGQFYGTDSNASRAQMQRITQGTAVASTSGTFIDFTGLPAWIKRITILFNGTSLSSTADLLVQLGTGSTTFTTSGYNSTYCLSGGGGNALSTSTAGFVVRVALAAGVNSGNMIINNVSGNIWVAGSNVKRESTGVGFGAGEVTLGAVLTAVRITSTSTDTFDAGSLNILYEG